MNHATTFPPWPSWRTLDFICKAHLISAHLWFTAIAVSCPPLSYLEWLPLNCSLCFYSYSEIIHSAHLHVTEQSLRYRSDHSGAVWRERSFQMLSYDPSERQARLEQLSLSRVSLCPATVASYPLLKHSGLFNLALSSTWKALPLAFQAVPLALMFSIKCHLFSR